jgi:hypothetical protein
MRPGFLIAAIFAGIFVAAGADAQCREAGPVFNPSGGYHPLNPPNHSSDKFVQMSIRVTRRGGRMRAAGEVRGVQPWYRFSTFDISEKSLRFSTRTSGGIRYEFKGEFLGKGNFARTWCGKGLVLLKGRLRKYVRSKKVWEINTPFVYYPPH